MTANSLARDTPGFSWDFPPSAPEELVAPGDFAGKRGEYNKDGSECMPVGYFLTNSVLTHNQVEFVWNTGNGQEGAAFEYTVVWKPEYTVGGIPARQTKVKWAAMGANPAVPGRACVAPNLPAPIGTLDTSLETDTTKISASDTTIEVTGGSPLPGKFPIVIGKERMLVTGVSGTTWTVERGNGGTTAAEHRNAARDHEHAASARRCRKRDVHVPRFRTVASAPAGVADCLVPDPNPDNELLVRSCVLFKTTVFDLGDGIISRGGGGGS